MDPIIELINTFLALKRNSCEFIFPEDRQDTAIVQSDTEWYNTILVSHFLKKIEAQFELPSKIFMAFTPSIFLENSISPNERAAIASLCTGDHFLTFRFSYSDSLPVLELANSLISNVAFFDTLCFYLNDALRADEHSFGILNVFQTFSNRSNFVFKYRVLNVQQQTNGNDCALHSILNVLIFALHSDPTKFRFSTVLREYLRSCYNFNEIFAPNFLINYNNSNPILYEDIFVYNPVRKTLSTLNQTGLAEHQSDPMMVNFKNYHYGQTVTCSSKMAEKITVQTFHGPIICDDDAKSPKIAKKDQKFLENSVEILPAAVISHPVETLLPLKSAKDSKGKPKYFLDPVSVAEYMATRKCTEASAKKALRRQAQKGNESALQKQMRLEEQRIQKNISRQSKSTEETSKRMDKDRKHKNMTRQSETTEDRELRLKKNRLLKEATRESETAENRDLRLKNDRELKEATRESETPENRDLRLKKNRELKKATHESETPEDRELRLKKNRLLKKATYESETPEDRELRLKKNRLLKKATHESETPEDRELRLKKNRLLKEATHESETPEDRELRLKKNRLLKEATRESETPEHRDLKLKKDRELKKATRESDTPEDRDLKLKKDRELKEATRKLETLEERETRLYQDRVGHSEAYYNRTFKEDPKYFRIAFKSLNEVDYDSEIIHLKYNDDPCKHCGAYKLPLEPPGLCCMTGKIKIREFERPGDEIQSLYEGNGEYAKMFAKFSRLLNTGFAFSHMHCTELPSGQVKPCMKVHGFCYQALPPLEPTAGTRPRYAQVHIFDKVSQKLEREKFKFEDQYSVILNYIQAIFNNFIQENNTLSRTFKTGYEMLERMPKYRLVLGDCLPANRTHLLPTVSEIAGLYLEKDIKELGRVILVRKRADEEGYIRVDFLSPFYEPLGYPLIFNFGQKGWSRWHHLLKTGHKETLTQYLKYLLMVRDNFFNPLILSGNLLHQYAIDMKMRLDYLNFQYQVKYQEKIKGSHRLESVDTIKDCENPAEVGVGIILSESTPGTPKWYKKLYRDSMALVREFGCPDLFVTMTCNPKLPEIQEMARNHKDNPDKYRPDLICRSFMERVRLLFNVNIKKRGIFGKCVSYSYKIEFQKRGLPHVHGLIWLTQADKILSSEDVDRLIRAEIPIGDSKNQKLAYEFVTTKMIHGPCGMINPRCSCMKPSKKFKGTSCSKMFPKNFNNTTNFNAANYPNYRRRTPDNNGGQGEICQAGKKKCVVTSRDVVPHNLYLGIIFQSHINLEVVSSVSVFQYIFKYILKGSDHINYEMKKVTDDQGNPVNEREKDEVKIYLNGRYMSSVEAIWSILCLSQYGMYPSVLKLDIHLDGQQKVFYDPKLGKPDAKTLERLAKTKLTEFFTLNRVDKMANNFLYLDIPKFYTWMSQERFWKRRVLGENDPEFGMPRGDQISRMPNILPNSGGDQETFALYLLLLKIKGPKCYTDLRTVGDEVFPTFKEAAVFLQIMEAGNEISLVLHDAQISMSPQEMRRMFAMLIHFWKPNDALSLWNDHRDSMSHDLARADHDADMHIIYNRALHRIYVYLIGYGTKMDSFNLPQPNEEVRVLENQKFGIFYESTESSEFISDVENSLNADQRELYDSVLNSVKQNAGKNFFVDAPGGTGKTYLMNAIVQKLASQGYKVTACASSGIAALLLKGGTTLHSRMKLPLNPEDKTALTIQKGSKLAKELAELDLIIWDEAPMFSRYVMEFLDKTLRFVRGGVDPSEKTFGGITMLLSGDWRQVLPVVPNGERSQIVASTLKKHPLWKTFAIFRLNTNMRVYGVDQASIDFKALLLRIGDGVANLKQDNCTTHNFVVPPEFLLTGDTPDLLIDKIYPNVSNQLGEIDYVKWVTDRAIITPTNSEVAEINQKVLDRLPGREIVIPSFDRNHEQTDRKHNVPIDTLNSIVVPGMPDHLLKLKLGAPVILLRNICPAEGHCNGTRYVVKNIRPRILELEVAVGPRKGQLFHLPRIELHSEEGRVPFNFYRKQFPVKLSFAMTSNKSQGQTINHVGISCLNDFFSHGQFYVAISRVTNPANVTILVPENQKGVVRNVVYPEVFRN